jgi:hypothetical protein
VFFQKILKGIGGIDRDAADAILGGAGIPCTWWHNAPDRQIRPDEIQAKLTPENLDRHLNDYDAFGPETPFISTTAGAVQGVYFLPNRIYHEPLAMAIHFATDGESRPGFVFYGYVFTIGKKAVELWPFAEEVREMHIYTEYLPYHHEGEIVAKIIIPSIQLERWEFYDPAAPEWPGPAAVRGNQLYERPERFANVREVLDV